MSETRAEESQLSAKLEHILMTNLTEYKPFINYTESDLLLKLVASGSNNVTPYKETLGNFVSNLSGTITHSVSTSLYKFLDFLLVKNSDFISKYLYWLKKLGAVELVLKELEQFTIRGIPPKIHQGMIICSATDSTEDKVIKNYGGSEWKRVMNFMLGTKPANSSSKPYGSMGGESYVSLVRDNILNHTHGLSYDDKNSPMDVWKSNTGESSNVFTTTSSPGPDWGTKLVYPEISPLGWSDDGTPETNRGSSRYVRPHSNIPPYKDVYIWECVNAADAPSRTVLPDLLDDPDTPVLQEETRSMPSRDSATITGDVWFKDITQYTKISSQTHINNLQKTVSFDSVKLMVSDELQKSIEERFESKGGTLGALANILSYVIFNGMLHIENRYLLRETYNYLISDIQDKIYLTIKRIGDVQHGLETITKRLRAFKGQYILIYNDGSITDEAQYINQFYVIPTGCGLIRLQGGTFLRGTSSFTEESVSEYTKYTDENSKVSDIRTSGGSSTVRLNYTHVPKHLHWSTLLQGMPSYHITDGDSATKGAIGSDMFMNDIRSGGVMYGMLSGSGNYYFTTQDVGKTSFAHNNLPPYKTLGIWQVV